MHSQPWLQAAARMLILGGLPSQSIFRAMRLKCLEFDQHGYVIPGMRPYREMVAINSIYL